MAIVISESAREALTHPVVNTEVAAELLGVGNSSVHDAIRNGTFNLPVVRVSSRIFIATAPLLRYLGLDDTFDPETQ